MKEYPKDSIFFYPTNGFYDYLCTAILRMVLMEHDNSKCDFVSHLGTFQKHNGIDRREAFGIIEIDKIRNFSA